MYSEKIKALRKEHRVKVDAQKAIADLLKKEDRSFTDDERVNFDQLSDDIDTIEKSITDLLKLEKAALRAAAVGKAPATPQGAEGPEKKAKKRYSLVRAIGLMAEGKPLDGIEAEMHQEAKRELARSGQALEGLGIPSMMMGKNDRVIEVATDVSAGHLVGTETADVIGALRPKLVIEEMGATVMSGLVGNLDLPIGDGLATAAWKSEQGQNNETTPTVRNVELRPKRLTAYTDVSKQILIQTSGSVENWIRDELSNAIARAVDAAAINGSGTSNQPNGILNTTTVNAVEMGTNGDNITRAKLIEMITNVAANNADVDNMGFILTPEVRGFLQDLKTDAGSGLFVWNDALQNMLLGYKAATTNLMPKNLVKGSATACHGMIFGDFSQLVLGSWGGADLIVNPYSKAKDGLVEIVVNSFWDIAVKHGKGFSAIKDITV